MASTAQKMGQAAKLDALRRQLAALEQGSRAGAVLPFGVPAIDTALPGGGLALGAMHELEGATGEEEDGAVAAAFLAGILARLSPERPVLWCLKRPDLHAPGLALFGLSPQRLILARALNGPEILWVMEEGLRSAALAAVVGEITEVSMTATRRLQLAAESAGVTGFMLRRQTSAAASSAVTRWRITALPGSPAVGEPGVGRAQWQVELLRCRGGVPASWKVEACDATGFVSLSAAMADRTAKRRRAAG
jgi:protein ImuA